jgi:hypothetical protein
MTRRCAWIRRIADAIAGAAVLALPALDLQAQPPPNTEQFVVGIGRSIHDSLGVATAMSWLGVQSMRLDAPWKSIETAPGRYAIPAWLEEAVDSARARGIEPLLILAYGHPLHGGDKPRTSLAIAAFARYAVYVTKHFEGRVRYFDLWNEWDARTGHTTPGTPDDYIALARSVYPAVKSAAPDAIVLSGGISSLGSGQGWVERFIELGGLQFVDGLSLHPYSFQQRGASAPENAIAQLDRVHALASAASRPVPIYVTEMGYPAFEGRGGVSADVAALYLARFNLLASTRPHIAGVWWYCLRDQGTDRNDKEHNFGVLDATMEPKPAARALRAVAQLLSEVQRFHDESRGTEHRISATRADGTKIVLAWSEGSVATQLLSELAALTAQPDARAAAHSSRR